MGTVVNDVSIVTDYRMGPERVQKPFANCLPAQPQVSTAKDDKASKGQFTVQYLIVLNHLATHES